MTKRADDHAAAASINGLIMADVRLIWMPRFHLADGLCEAGDRLVLELEGLNCAIPSMASVPIDWTCAANSVSPLANALSFLVMAPTDRNSIGRTATDISDITGSCLTMTHAKAIRVSTSETLLL